MLFWQDWGNMFLSSIVLLVEKKARQLLLLTLEMVLLKFAELEQAAALKYLYGWLRHHPKYGTLAPPELADSLYYADVGVFFVSFCVSSCT